MAIEVKITSEEEIETAFILTKELIEYHNALDIFTMTQQRFGELVNNGSLISYIAYADGKAVGVLNMFYKYTTFSGRKILYIEDLYAREEYRGFGIGKKLIETARKTAAENCCEKIELKCADWNVKAAEFYKGLGMKPESEWITYTLDKSLF